MNIAQIHRDEADYPKLFASYLGSYAPRTIWALGNRDILNNKKIGFFLLLQVLR
jgi:predicted Rossmann fold nucleotide-binding protein DprA/Smf involved in DNA uptake